MLQYLLKGKLPSITDEEASFCCLGLTEYARSNYTILEPTKVNNQYIPLVLKDLAGQKIGIWVIHPLQAKPSSEQTQAILAKSGIRIAIHNSFDLHRRPFWVMNNLLS